MAFVNQHIAPDDVVKYGIEEIDKRYVVGGTSARDWTVDRERDIYLRNVAAGREESASRLIWTLYWRGTLMHAETETIKVNRRIDGSRHAHKWLKRIDVPPGLAIYRDEILNDLREALVAYKDGGVYATAADYSLTLDI